MKEFWLWGSAASEQQQSLVSLFLRLFFSIAMLTHGIPKIEHFAELSMQFPDPLGIGSEASLALAILAEVGCSFLLILGLFTRLAALTLVINMAVASMLVTASSEFASSELAAIYLVVYVAISVLGAGVYSLDWVLFSHNYHYKRKPSINVAPLDRMFRLLLGLLCWFLLFTGVVSGVWTLIVIALSVPLFVTSFWGYCGLYSCFLKGDSCQK
ncbi:MAG: DoxX family protein [Phocaeicola sp.]